MTKPHDPSLVNESTLFLRLLPGLAALTFAVFFASNFAGAFVFDDGPNLTNNPAVTGFSPWSLQAWWSAAFEAPARLRPVPYLSFALQWWLHGPSALGFHLVSDALHAMSAAALALLLFELLATPGASVISARDRALLAVGGAALWALHPVQTQAVTYIVQRMTVLCGLFSLLSLWLYMRGVRRGKKRDFIWSALCYALALLSKESAATLPLVLWLHEWIIADPSVESGARRKRRIALALAMVPPLAIASAYATMSGMHFALGELPGRDYALWQRVLSAPRVYFQGASLLLWPSGLALDHGMGVSRGLFSPWTTFAGWLALAAVVGETLFARREHRRLSWALLGFLVLQLPENTFLNLELFFEHRLYLPSALLIPLAPVALARIAASRPGFRTPAIALTLALIAICGALTVRRNLLWRDPVALMESNLEVTPANARARYNYGQALLRAGRMDEALAAYREAESRGYAGAAFAVGAALQQLGRNEEARAAYQRALKVHPRPAEAWINLGLMAKQAGDLAGADHAYKWALEFEPANTNALLNLANLRLQQGEAAEAEELYTRVIALAPGIALAWHGRMLARASQNKREEARGDYERALELGYDKAHAFDRYFGK